MSYSNSHPKWWQLYLSFPLLITLFVLDTRLRISVRGHQALQIGILLLIYGLIHLWLKANASALSNMDGRQYYRTVNVVRVPVAQMSDLEAQELPMIELPASEIKGVLSDTFEMDYIDIEFVHQEKADDFDMPLQKHSRLLDHRIHKE
jgi:hypothetical protein